MKRRIVTGWVMAWAPILYLGCTTTAIRSPVPVLPNIESLSGNGGFEVASYTSIPNAAEFSNATIYYPVDARERLGGVAIAPGFTERQSHIEWWGPRLASHGYAVLILDTNNLRDSPELRSDALIAGLRTLQMENGRRESPLAGKVDVSRMAVMGHSMGGGGALLVANELGDALKAAIPFTPWYPDADFSRITAPTLIIAGSADNIAGVDQHAWLHFVSIPASTPKVYMEIDRGDHFIADTERGEDLEMIGRYGVAWLKVYLDGDERYRDFIYGDAHRAEADKFSRYIIGAP